MGLSNTPRLPIEQHWLCPSLTASPAPVYRHYRPALLLECQLKFHHLRAQIKHTVERRYTTWYPKGHAMADWDLPVVSETDNLHFSIGPTLEIPHLTDGYQFTQEIHREFIDEFINKLVRTERLKIFHNSNFGAFSDPDESREQFITRLGERAAKSIEDDLANLIRRVHMKLAQVREAQERKGRKLEIADTYLNNILMERRHELFMSQSRLEALFSSGERLLVTSSDGWSSVSPVDDPENRELHQTLRMIEEDTKRELNELCTQCIQRASECDLFYIGLQPNQIHILRQGVLWIPLE